MTDAALRGTLGRVVAAFGAAYFFPVAFVWLSSGGPSPVLVSARAWSLFFYAHFILLVVAGFAVQALHAARSKLFHGGAMIDFLIVVAVFMFAESLAGPFLRRGAASAWAAMVPGAALAAAGVRLMSARPLLGRRDAS